MESFWNRLPDIGCQVHVQYSIRDEVAVDLADDGLLEGDSVILCPLLYHVLLAGTRPLCYVVYLGRVLLLDVHLILYRSQHGHDNSCEQRETG